MNKTLKYFLGTTMLVTILATSSCKDDEKLSQTVIEEEGQSLGHMEYVQIERRQPLNVRTLSGSYLVAQQAQQENDWKTASKYINQFLSENVNINHEYRVNIEKRAMILNLGAGNIDSALYYAKKQPKADESALSILVKTIPYIKKGQYEKAQGALEPMEAGGLSDLIKPVIKNWAIFGNDEKPPIRKNMTGHELYHMILAADYAEQGDYIKEITGAEIRQTGLSVKALENMADILVRHKLVGRALSIYQDIQQERPNDAGISAKVKILQEGGDLDEKDLFHPVSNPSHGIALAMLDIGMLLFQEDSLDSARIFAHVAKYLDPSVEDIYLLLAYVATSYEKYDEAISYLEKIIEHDPEQASKIQRQIADIQERAGYDQAALASLENLIETEDSLDLRVQIGDTARSNDQYKKALKSYNKAFSFIEGEEEDQKYWSLYYSRGIALERLGKWDDAERDLKKALELEPNHPYVLNYLGYSWADQNKNLQEALEMLKKAVNLRPDDGYIVDSLGWVYYKLENYEKAVIYLEKAVELMPQDPTLNDHLGDAYWKVGRKHEARFQWRRAKSFAEEKHESLSEEERIELVTKITEKLKVGL